MSCRSFKCAAWSVTANANRREDWTCASRPAGSRVESPVRRLFPASPRRAYSSKKSSQARCLHRNCWSSTWCARLPTPRWICCEDGSQAEPLPRPNWLWRRRIGWSRRRIANFGRSNQSNGRRFPRYITPTSCAIRSTHFCFRNWRRRISATRPPPTARFLCGEPGSI